MKGTTPLSHSLLFHLIGFSLVASFYDGPLYEHTAYSECKGQPEEPLYKGGIFSSSQSQGQERSISYQTVTGHVPSFLLYNLTQGIYSFSIWVRIEGASSSLVRASLRTQDETYDCIGNVLAKSGCWSFLKGGFVLDWTSNLSMLYFESSDGKDIDIAIASPSLQPFTKEQWRTNQQYIINTKRKRAVTIHVSDTNGKRLQGAAIAAKQLSKDFPFGSAIARTILGNSAYQNWFVKRFNAAVFENELKWVATEPEQGKLNYTIPDQMLQFVRSNQIIARGHNIFWE